MAGIPIRFIIVAFALELSFALACLLSPQVEKVVPILLLAGAVWMIGVYFIVSEAAVHPHLLTFIIATSIVFRFTLWPVDRPFTDDLYRYRWEGKLQAYGGNPYQARPGDPDRTFLRDETYDRVGLKDFKGAYGPAWEMIERVVFEAVSRTGLGAEAQVFWFKLPAALADIGVVGTLILLLRIHGQSPERVLIYAWSPLPVWEFWASGHNDAVPLVCIVAALIASSQARWWRASAALGVATALKLWPILLFPAFARAARSVRQTFLGILVATAFAIPYWTPVTENIRFLTGFVGGWRNNDSLFGLILLLSPDLQTAKYTAMSLIGLTALSVATRNWTLERKVLWTAISLLLFSANCHPWYLTWFLPLLVFEIRLALLLWVAIVPLLYRVWIDWSVTGEWNGLTPWRWLVYGPVFLVGLWSALRSAGFSVIAIRKQTNAHVQGQS